MVKLTETLVLARSRASDIENVRKFNCWGSDLSDVRIIRRMPNVQILSLSVNKISTLADFAHCPDLEELYIRKNNISDLNEICHLRGLSKLRSLWLADNPCASEDGYRMTVLKNLPNLQRLDNVAVAEDEVNAAIELGHDLLPPVSACESVDLRAVPRPGALLPVRDAASKKQIVSTSLPAFSLCNGESSSSSASSPEEAGHQVSPEVSTTTGNEDSGAAGAEAEPTVAVTTAGDVSTTTTSDSDRDTLSWEETNRIRVQLGLKPLPVERAAQRKPRVTHTAKARNANLLQATLHLIRELDSESLEVVADAIHNRLADL